MSLPAPSSWGTEQLFASRVVVFPTRNEPLRLPIPIDHAVPEEMQDLSKIFRPLQSHQLKWSETKLIQQLGGTAGMFWATLHRFTRSPAVPASSELSNLDSSSRSNSDTDMASSGSEDLEGDDHVDLPIWGRRLPRLLHGASRRNLQTGSIPSQCCYPQMSLFFFFFSFC